MENNYMDISSDKLMKSHTRRFWVWLRKKNFETESELILIAAGINALRTNYVEEKFDRTYSNLRSCGDREKNDIVNLPQTSARVDTTRWRRWTIGDRARNSDLSILLQGICISQNSSLRMRCIIFSAIL